MPNRDLYQETTDVIIAALDAGVAPWVCPWNREGETGLPRNGFTGRPYNGTNIFLLWARSILRGFRSSDFYTFHQAKLATGYTFEKSRRGRGRYIWEGKGKDPGFGVRKGETSSTVLHWHRVTRRNDQEDDIQDSSEAPNSSFMVPKHYNVFNRDQIEGLPAPEAPHPMTEWERNQLAEDFINATGARITIGGARAFYSPTHDEITLPERGRFDDPNHFYATAAHELVHWTAPRITPERRPSGGFGSVEFAEEELVAELGAAFIAAHLGLAGELHHPEYIRHWLGRLKDDKRFFFKAAADARRAADYLGAAPEPLDQASQISKAA